MSEEYHDRPVDRRGFLKALTVTAVAATATGAGAALLSSPRRPATTIVPSASLATPMAVAGDQATDLLAQLAAVQAENIRLQAALEAAQRRLAAQEQADGAADSTLQAMSVELDAAHGRIGLLAGLVALYEQLDEANVADWLEDGVTAVTDAITELVADLPGLDEGVILGQQALAQLDDHIPLLENGRAWLSNQAGKIAAYFEGVETVLATAVEQAGPFLQMFNEWAQNILSWLPFGLGQRTSAVMEALTALLLETPYTVSGLQTNVAEPLAVWLGEAGDEAPLRQNLIKPMREQLLAQAEQVAGKTWQTHSLYQEKLARPLDTAVANQRQVRQLIAAYRQQHNV